MNISEHISIHFKLITRTSLATIGHHTRYYLVLGYILHTIHFIPVTHLFWNWKFVFFFFLVWLHWVFVAVGSSLLPAGSFRCGIWDLSSLTRNQTHIPWIARQILNHWMAREGSDSSIFNFLRDRQLFSIVATPIYIPTNSAQGFPFPSILANSCYLLYFKKAILTVVRWLSHCGSDLHFPFD